MYACGELMRDVTLPTPYIKISKTTKRTGINITMAIKIEIKEFKPLLLPIKLMGVCIIY
jgi:hypothetical protein